MQNNGLSKEALAIRSAEISSGLAGSDEKAKRINKNIYRRYGDIAIAMYTNPVMEGVIRGNPDTFASLCNRTVYVWATKHVNSEEFKSVAAEVPEIKKLFSSSQDLMSALEKVQKITGKSGEDITFRGLVEGLTNYKPDNIVPVLDDIEVMEESDDDYFDDGYFDDPNFEDVDVQTEPSNEYEGKDYYEDEDAAEGDVTDESDKDVDNNPSDLEDDEPDPEVEANTARVMNVYKELFEVGFELQIPYGILVKEGVLRISKDGKTVLKQSASLSRLYELINDCASKFLVQSTIGESVPASNLRNVRMRSGTTYYPEFQLGNLYGILGETKVDSWDALNNAIRSEVRQNIKTNIDEGKDISFIVDALTTCIVISEFDPKVALKLRINVGNRLLNTAAFEKEYNNRKSTIMAGTGELYHINQLPSGIVEVTLVFNKAAFNGRPLFAYEAVRDLVRRGRTPSLKEMILGQDTSGKILTVNLNRQNACIILIGAGQRSGKGVLTLNLLGTILAEGQPLVYLDGKPDMSLVLWDVAKKNGVNPAVWDAFYANGNILGRGAPEEILRENSEIFGVLMYLKCVQLMMASAHLRTKGIKVGGADKRPFFVFDEALAVQAQMQSSWPRIVAMAKDKKDTSETAVWCRRVVQWAEQLNAGLISTINSQLPMSGVSTVWLFQSVQPTSWGQFDTEGMRGKFNILKNPIMSRLSIKLLGKGTTDSEYGLGHKDLKNNKIITDRVVAEGGRHFVYTDAQKITDFNLVKVFKPYLVLNQAENGTPSVEELKGNVSNEVWNAIAPEGSLHPAAGFEGFANMIGQGAIQNLSMGRKFLEEVMHNLGLTRYSSVDEYLYDANVDSFKSLGTLLGGKDSVDGEADESELHYTSNAGLGEYTGNSGSYTDENAFETDDIEIDESSVGSSNIGYGTSIDYGRPVVDRQMLEEINARRAMEEDYRQSGHEGQDGLSGVDSIVIEKRNQQATQMYGKDGRINVIDTENTRNTSKLTNENSIDCRSAGPGPLSWIEKMTLNTPAGAERYVQKIWRSILDTIVSNGYKKANITRVSLHGGQMYINGRIVNLNGVIGGYQCIRLRDIVNFKILFKTFFMMKELRMDEDMLRAAVAELGDNPIEKFFSLAPKLEIVYIQTGDGATVSVDRYTMQNQKAQRMIERSKLENAIDLHCATRSKTDWSHRLAGDNIWGLTLAKSAMNNAGKAFLDQNKPRFGKAAVYAATGLVVGTVGGVAWGLAKLVGNVINMGRGFKK